MAPLTATLGFRPAPVAPGRALGFAVRPPPLRKDIVRRQVAADPAPPLAPSKEAVPAPPAVQAPKRSLLDSVATILIEKPFSWQGRLLLACGFLLHAASLYHIGHLGWAALQLAYALAALLFPAWQ